MKKNRIIGHIIVCTLVSIASACAELNAVRIHGEKDNKTAGAPYYLTFTQFEIDVTRRVLSCSPEVRVGVSAEIKRAEVRDPQRQYVIDFDALDSFFKKTNLALEYYEDGTLKSVNASAEDRTGEFIVNVVTTAGKVVAVAAGALPTRLGPARAGPICDDGVKNNIDNLAEANKNIKDNTKKVNNLVADVETLKAALSVLGRAQDPGIAKELSNKIRELRTAQTELEAARETLSQILNGITETYTVTWPENGEQFGVAIIGTVPDLSADAMKKWFKVSDPDFSNETKVYLQLSSNSSASRTKPCGDDCEDDTASGLKYRFGVPGTLKVCTTRACAPDDVLVEDSGMVSQLGFVHVLPLKSGMFSSNSISATFTEAGRPSTLGLGAEAASDKAGTTITGVVDQVIAVREKTVTTNADRIQTKIDELKLQKELADAKAALKPAVNVAETEATVASTAKKDLYEALLAEFKAREALKATDPSALP